MSERIPPTADQPAAGAASPGTLWLLVFIVAAEAIALVTACGWLVFELVVDRPSSLATGVALTVLVAITALWVSATAIGLARRQSWSRGSALTWQILQIALSFGAVQGQFAQPVIAAALMLPGLIAIGLIVSRGVRSSFEQPENPLA